jgi:photosystem II stability/assembly factor-like uncharacterized protein
VEPPNVEYHCQLARIEHRQCERSLGQRQQNQKAFLDCMAFWNATHGIVVGDALDGKAELLTTSDGGAHWTPLRPESIPPARDFVQEQLRNSTPHSRIVVFEQSGHFPMIEEQDKFTQVVNDFVRE